MTAKENALGFKFVDWNKNYEKKVSKDLANRFQSTRTFRDGDLNKFCLMLCKGIYPYKYMDSWQRFSETSLPDKK